jgi:hypothetical protein
MANFKGEDKKL